VITLLMNTQYYDDFRGLCLMQASPIKPILNTIPIPACCNEYPLLSWGGIVVLILLGVLFLLIRFLPNLSEKYLRSKVTVAIRRFRPHDFLSQLLNSPSWTSFLILRRPGQGHWIG